MRALITAFAALASLLAVRTAGAHPPAGPPAPLADAAMLPAISEWPATVLAAALLTWLLLAMARECGRPPRVTALAASLFMLAFVAESAPHLVHHALGTDEGRHCQILVSADHADATAPAADLPPAPPVGRPLSETPRWRPAVSAPPAACERAPPAV